VVERCALGKPVETNTMGGGKKSRKRGNSTSVEIFQESYRALKIRKSLWEEPWGEGVCRVESLG